MMINNTLQQCSNAI